jgi:hypothetical protein
MNEHDDMSQHGGRGAQTHSYGIQLVRLNCVYSCKT